MRVVQRSSRRHLAMNLAVPLEEEALLSDTSDVDKAAVELEPTAVGITPFEEDVIPLPGAEPPNPHPPSGPFSLAATAPTHCPFRNEQHPD